MFSLLELEYPEKASRIVFDGSNQGMKQQWAEALDFVLSNLKSHMSDYHHRTDVKELDRSERILREAISGVQRSSMPDNAYLFIDIEYLRKNYSGHFANKWFGEGEIDFEYSIG